MSHYTLTVEQQEAVERSEAGGLVAYINRLRLNHGPAFKTGVLGELYAWCRCGEPGCHLGNLLVHIDNLIAAYESKVADFARETSRDIKDKGVKG